MEKWKLLLLSGRKKWKTSAATERIKTLSARLPRRGTSVASRSAERILKVLRNVLMWNRSQLKRHQNRPTFFWNHSLRLINGRYLLIVFFSPLFECEYPKICAVKTQQCSIFSIFRIMQEKGCNILAPTKKIYFKSNISACRETANGNKTVSFLWWHSEFGGSIYCEIILFTCRWSLMFKPWPSPAKPSLLFMAAPLSVCASSFNPFRPTTCRPSLM